MGDGRKIISGSMSMRWSVRLESRDLRLDVGINKASVCTLSSGHGSLGHQDIDVWSRLPRADSGCSIDPVYFVLNALKSRVNTRTSKVRQAPRFIACQTAGRLAGRQPPYSGAFLCLFAELLPSSHSFFPRDFLSESFARLIDVEQGIEREFRRQLLGSTSLVGRCIQTGIGDTRYLVDMIALYVQSSAALRNIVRCLSRLQVARLATTSERLRRMIALPERVAQRLVLHQRLSIQPASSYTLAGSNIQQI